MGRRSEHCTMAPHPLLYLLFAGAFVSAGVGPQKDRVLQARPLSDKERVEGDYAYDHDAFLGEEQAEQFLHLDPTESRRRLAVMVGRMDEDRDGLVSEEELQKWIRSVQEREVMEDTERQWEERNKAMYKGDPEGRVSWESYKNDIYGFVEEVGEERNGYSFEPMMDRDLRRWTAADNDGDMLLTKLEFQAFLHPEESAHMKDIIVLETMEDMDKDGDSRLSLEEYIGDLYPGQDDGEDEPDWVREEKELFATERDKDGDGFMSADEVKIWIVPADFDHSLAEARHLLRKADADGDSLLSEEEVLDQYDMFVGSSATQFGDVLTRHDEF